LRPTDNATTEPPAPSRAVTVLAAFVVFAACVAQNATTIAIPSNGFDLAERGLAVPIEYGWPLPCVGGLFTDTPAIYRPETHWTKSNLDRVLAFPLILNFVVLCTLTFFAGYATHQLQQFARPHFSLGMSLGLLTFVAIYMANKLAFDPWETPINTWRIKIPVSFKRVRAPEELYMMLEFILWTAILATCLTIPKWISHRLAGRNHQKST
jgi:hypothetical protein